MKDCLSTFISTIYMGKYYTTWKNKLKVDFHNHVDEMKL